MKALIPRSCPNLYCIGNKTYDQVLLTKALHLTENPKTIDALALLGDEGICVNAMWKRKFQNLLVIFSTTVRL